MYKNSFLTTLLTTLDLKLIRCYNTLHAENDKQREYHGVFGLHSSNVRGKPKTVFFYYDYKFKQITHSRLYSGKSYYREYNKFLSKVLDTLKKNDVKRYVLTSNHFTSKSVEKYVNSINNNLIIRQMHMESKNKLERGIKHKNHLDILARLITSQHSNKNIKDVCVAICSHDKKLFIASNKKKAEYSKECLIDLQELLKNNSVKSCEKLLKKAVEKIRYIELKSNSSNVIIKEFKEKARECSENKNPDWASLQVLAEKLFHSLREEIKGKSKDNSRINQMWKFLMPWHEVGEVVRLIIEKNLDDFIKTSIEQCKKKVVYVEDEESSPNEEIPVHAEMKIVNKLYREKEKQTQEIRYIGNTKKACSHCQAIIDVFNEDGKYYWENSGTHGGTYINCKYPNIVNKYDKEQEVKNRIEEIKSIGLNPGNSTTSEIPETLTNPGQLLDKLRVAKRNKNSGEMGDVENQNNLKI